MTDAVLLQTDLTDWPCRRGKVRDVYDLGEQLLIVTTDRLSAFDWVLPTGIPDKGRVLTQLSAFWFAKMNQAHHLLSTNVNDVPWPAGTDTAPYVGRIMLVRKTQVAPVECVIRGYLAGSGWKEYRQAGTVCGLQLPVGLQESDALPAPIFTPATKAETGHDENISFAQMAAIVTPAVAEELRDRSLAVYQFGAAIAREKGIIIADTKFEWGWDESQKQWLLIDEVLTPDSSRFWPAADYAPGRGQASFDKQFVRDWLETTKWDKQSPPPALPAEIAAKTAAKYREAYERITGQVWSSVL